MDLSKIDVTKIDVAIECLEEDTLPHGYFATGDEAIDKKLADGILEDLQSNPWAWCIVRVVATYQEFEGSSSLGACNYSGEESFKSSVYYPELVEQAIENLVTQLQKAENALDELSI
jgi:hypothetical protein